MNARRNALSQWELRFGPNMTPMVDIVMVILIFFMAGTAYLGQEWFLRAALPATGSGPGAADPFELPPAQFEISLARSPDGRTLATGLGLTGADLDTLAAAARALATDTGGDDLILLLRVAPDVPYRDVVAIHDACAAAGITKIGLR